MILNKISYQPVYQITRGEAIESVHFGAIAIANSQGELVAWYGEPTTLTFLRSSSKPLQALPFIEKGGAERFGLSLQEIALLCASHSGTDAHFKVARSIQQKVGISEDNLLCGVHPSFHKPTANLMADRGEAPSPNRHNCSGKHTGMLAYAKMEGYPIENYPDPEHPIQQNILQTLSEMCSLEVDEIKLGIDGCSVPCFAMPMYNAALAWARLADPNGLPPERATACQTITSAMTGYPNMVAGPGRFDTRLMEVAKGKIIAKGGAEAYQGLGIPAGALGRHSQALGIAVKLADGDTRRRAKEAVVLEVLKQLNALTDQELEDLQEFGPNKTMYNWRKLVVGQGGPCFTLNYK